MKTNFESDNLSGLMVDLLSEFNNHSGSERSGVSISINGFNGECFVNEDLEIRQKFDSYLKKLEMQPVATVANTIFPLNLWNRNNNRELLYDRYNNIFPQLKKCKHNRLGTYFNRIINYDDKGLNQLEFLIDAYKSGTFRRSAFQVSIWDPARDLKNTITRGFPCLQHLVFPCTGGKLKVVAFYASQYLFERAYGNLLGICNLGTFMAHELKIPLAEVKCYIGVEILGVKKSVISDFLSTQLKHYT